MRLIDVRTKELTEFFDNNVPPYAVLSHTWGREELTYEDAMSGKNDFSTLALERKLREQMRVPLENSETPLGSNVLEYLPMSKRFRPPTMGNALYGFVMQVQDNINLLGYSKWLKLLCACRKALLDGYSYLWIDTCCIQKSSSSELSEAINSMFNWYKESAICYVYLDDVSDSLLDPNGLVKNSRWFSRGWTLQELLAPKNVLFLSKTWEPLGTKNSLRSPLARATFIPERVLEDSERIWSTSISRRMSWAARRETTRTEDQAYCLLGIFGVNMPLLYGERERAFLRLQEEIIKVSDDQTIFAWNGSDPEHGAFAQKPSDFKDFAYLVPFQSGSGRATYAVTHRGLQMNFPSISTGAYFGSREILAAVLDCHVALDYSRQTVMYICRGDGSDTFVRCKFRGKHTAAIETSQTALAGSNSESLWFLQTQSRVYYQRPSEIICHLDMEDGIAAQFKVKLAKVQGIESRMWQNTKTAAITRTPEAYSHDIATAFIFFDNTHSKGFIVVVYFPAQSRSIKLATLEKSSRGLSESHIQETANNSRSADFMMFPRHNSDHRGDGWHDISINISLHERNAMGQLIYDLKVDYTPPPVTRNEGRSGKLDEKPANEMQYQRRTKALRWSAEVYEKEGRAYSKETQSGRKMGLKMARNTNTGQSDG